MSQVKRYINFNYNCLPSIIECKRYELMKNICQRFCKKIGGDLDDFNLKYENMEVNFELSFNNQTKEKEKRNCLFMYLFVEIIKNAIITKRIRINILFI